MVHCKIMYIFPSNAAQHSCESFQKLIYSLSKLFVLYYNNYAYNCNGKTNLCNFLVRIKKNSYLRLLLRKLPIWYAKFHTDNELQKKNSSCRLLLFTYIFNVSFWTFCLKKILWNVNYLFWNTDTVLLTPFLSFHWK